MVEVHLDLVRRARDRLTARELELLDEVLVRDLGEAAALVRVEVDVVDVERGRDEARRRDAVTDGVRVRRRVRVVPAEVVELVELEPDLDLVVLERNQREREARVAAEPELEGHVERVLRRAALDLLARVGLGVRRAGRIAALTALDEEVDKVRDVTNHLRIARLLAGLLRELIPDLEPVTVVLVDLLAANLNIDVVDKIVADPVEPAELRAAAVARLERNLGKRRLEVDAVDQVAVAADRALDLLAEVGRAVERLLDGLHRKVRVAAVYNLEESNLGVTRKIDVLSAVRDKLH